MSDIANALAVGVLAVSPGSEGGKTPEVVGLDNGESNPPVVEPLEDVGKKDSIEVNGIQFEQISPAEYVVLGDSGNGLSESEKEIIEERGGIFLNGVDYTFTVESPLGAYDKYGNLYQGAIPEGGILNVNGAKFKLTYETGYFDEVTFLYSPEGSSLKAGQIFPYMIFLPSDAYGKAFRAVNYADSPKNIERDIYTDTREPAATYLVMPIITTSHSDILPPSVDENGNIINKEYESFVIEPGGTTGSTTGYLSWAIMKLTKDSDKDYFDLEFLGIQAPSSDNKLYMELEKVPDDIVDKCGFNG